MWRRSRRSGGSSVPMADKANFRHACLTLGSTTEKSPGGQRHISATAFALAESLLPTARHPRSASMSKSTSLRDANITATPSTSRQSSSCCAARSLFNTGSRSRTDATTAAMLDVGANVGTRLPSTKHPMTGPTCRLKLTLMVFSMEALLPLNNTSWSELDACAELLPSFAACVIKNREN